MNTLVVVPMKSAVLSKTRLSGCLTDVTRRRVAQHLFRRTITTLARLQTHVAFDLAVVTASAAIARVAETAGATQIADPDRGLNAALASAARYADENRYDQICIFPADLTAPTDEELVRVITQQTSADAVLICPSVDGGTNALRLRPGAMDFCFGVGSARRHAHAARQAGLTPITLRLASLSCDIDTAADLAHAMRQDRALRAMA
ncbi:MAG: 2-phospho-L-lactate guanylyltransferase [Pseudomonadota bacterium]